MPNRSSRAVAAALALALIGALPAAAQTGQTTTPAPGSPAPSSPAEEPSYAEPPPVDLSLPVPSSAIPGTVHTQGRNGCVRTGAQDLDIKGAPWGQDRLQFDRLRDFATGEGVTVAVIDTGVFPHPWLEDRLTGAGDYVVEDKNGLHDCDGHGTLVAGIIAADTPADHGFRGIAPGARILSIRQSSKYFVRRTDDGREVEAGTLGTLAAAVVRAVEQGADVVNMSVNQCRPAGPITPEEQVLHRALRFAHDEGVVLVASAGNIDDGTCKDPANGFDPGRPTNVVTPPWFSEYVLSVAAMDRNGDPAAFSVQGPWVGVSAPGTETVSLSPVGPGLANQTGQPGSAETKDVEGTSFAAPYVAGLAALIKERYRDLSPRQVMDRIMLTAARPAAVGGRDNLVGHGMINPVAALTAMIPAEHGVAPEGSVDVDMAMPPAVPKDWTPTVVALAGAGGGVLLLLITLFVVRTANRNRPGAAREPRGHA